MKTNAMESAVVRILQGDGVQRALAAVFSIFAKAGG